MKSLLISLITYNSHESTDVCLASLDRLQDNDIDIQVLVIDNASTEAYTLDVTKYKHIKPVIIRSEVNMGFSGGHNIGITYAEEKNIPYILILNNDTIVDPALVTSLLQAAETDTAIGLICPKIYFTKGSEFHHDRYTKAQLGRVLWYAGGEMDWKNLIGHHRGVDQVDEGQFDKAESTAFATGCCMLIRMSMIQKVGKLDSRYFLYYEDADFSVRVTEAGYRIHYEPKAILWHTNAASTGGSGSSLQDYFISRNRLLFGLRYAPFRTKIALVRESISLRFYGRMWQQNGVRDYYLRRFGKGSYKV